MNICSGGSLHQILHKWLSDFNLGSSQDKVWTYLMIAYLIFTIVFTYYISGKSDRISAIRISFWFLVLFIGAIVVQIPNLATGFMHVDESQHIGEAIKLSKDTRFWHSVDGTTVGPISIFIPTFFIWMGIDLDYAIIRIISILIWALIAIINFKTFLLFVNINKSLWYTSLSFAVFPFFFHSDYVSYNGEIMAALLLSLILYLTLLTIGKRCKYHHVIILGALLVLAPLTKLQIGPVVFVTGTVVLIVLRNQRRLLTIFLSTAFVTLAFFILYLLVTDVFQDFVESYLVNNLFYTSTGIGLKYDRDFVGRFFKFPLTLFQLVETRHMLLCVFLLSGLYIVRIVKKFNYFGTTFTEGKFCALFFVLLLIVIGVPGHKYFHYTILIIPTSILLSGLLYEKMFYKYDGHLILFVSFIVIPQAFMSSFENKEDFSVLENTEANYGKDMAIALRLCSLSKGGQKIAQWGYDTYIYSETDLIMGTRDTQTHRHALALEQRKYYLDRYISDLKENNPEFFIDTTRKNGFLFDFDKHNYTNFPELRKYILEHYNFVEELNGAQIFARKDLSI